MLHLLLRGVLIFCPAILFLSGCRSEPELVWHEESGYRWADLGDWNGSDAGFEAVAPSRSAVKFSNTLTEESLLQNRHLMNGSGVALGDVDGDGRVDLYLARLDGPNVLYRNLGNWRFEEITDEAGVAASDRYSTGAVFADIDGDSDLDLLVTAMGGPNAAYLNDGDGRFTEVTEAAGLVSQRGGTTMALADVDGDGDLDLYVSNYKAKSINDIYPPAEHTFERTVIRDGSGFSIAPEFEEHYHLLEHAGGMLRVERAEANRFYLNDGSGHFTHVPFTDGAFRSSDGTSIMEAPGDWTLTARFQDANGDGAPDLYVCNDFHSPDYFWIGDGKGNFQEVSPLSVRKTSFSTMSVDFSDIDRDGHLDFFLTDMLSRDYTRRQTQVGLTIPMTTAVGEIENRPQAVQNTLHLNRGDDTYAEIARLSGVAASDWTWSGLFLDVDLDGYEDLLLATGHLYDVIDKDAQLLEIHRQNTVDGYADRRLLLEYPALPLRNVAFRNEGDLQFEFVDDGWGIGEEPDVSNALAFGDLDNDGDLDVVVNRLDGTAGLFRNEATAPRVAVRLRGEAPNTQGVGAKIRVHAEGIPMQEKEVVSGGIYLSGSDPVYSFAAGTSDEPVSIDVIWRDGSEIRLDSIGANRLIEVHQGERARSPTYRQTAAEANGSRAVLFEDASSELGHDHFDTPIENSNEGGGHMKPFSRLGPGIAWSDIDGDGADDLVVGTGRGHVISTYLSDGSGTFSLLNTDLPAGPTRDDVTGVVILPDAQGATIFAGFANIESTADSSWIEQIRVNASGQVERREKLPFGRSSVGPLALADVDGDGDLDLFAGARVNADAYPESTSSRIFRNDNGEFRHDASMSSPIEDAGMISGAAFGDLDGDGDQDLVLAPHWGSLKYFENTGEGRFVERTADLGLKAYSGWWNGVALGDFDADGRLDIVATNLGWNSEHERLHQADDPVRLYNGDFDADGASESVEAVYEPERDSYVPVEGLTVLSERMPYIRQRISSFQEYGESTLRDIVGFRLDQADVLNANTASHMLFLNRPSGGDLEGLVERREASLFRLDGLTLPLDAQVAPAFAPVVADFNGDGFDDLFLSQNLFAYPMGIPRQDAGRGLLLVGDGRGEFKPLNGRDSGIRVYGEQRGAAASDVDADGRVDLLVSQHGARSKLYRNAQAPPGIRVRVLGPPENPSGIGAVLRARYDDGSESPARAVSGGSGYWSQNSPVHVFNAPVGRRIVSIGVRRPNGSELNVLVPSGSREIAVPHAEEP